MAFLIAIKGADICIVGIKLETWELLTKEEGVESRKQGSPSGHGLTWWQTGLYLSPGLFRTIPSCLELKLDMPMDFANGKESLALSFHIELFKNWKSILTRITTD